MLMKKPVRGARINMPRPVPEPASPVASPRCLFMLRCMKACTGVAMAARPVPAITPVNRK